MSHCSVVRYRPLTIDQLFRKRLLRLNTEFDKNEHRSCTDPVLRSGASLLPAQPHCTNYTGLARYSKYLISALPIKYVNNSSGFLYKR